VLISQSGGLPATGSTIRRQPTGGSELQVVVLAEALAARGLRVGITGPFFAFALDRGVAYVPLCEVVGRSDPHGGPSRPSAKLRTRVLVSERFGALPPGVEFERVVFDLHDIPDQRLGHVAQAMHEIPEARCVVHSPFAASLLDGWPSVSVIPCMLPDEFYEPLPKPVKLNERAHRYVYGSAALKGLAPTLELWRELKREKGYHWKKAQLVVCSPGYDAIDPRLLEGVKDVVVQHGLSPMGMQALLSASDGVFMVSTYPETFGIVFHQAEIAGVPAYVLRAHGNADALDTTLANPEMVVDRRNGEEVEEFVSLVEDPFDAPLKPAHDFSVSAVLPQWLDVLGLAAGASEAVFPPALASGVPAAGSTNEENAA
jgi:hypothetical protein